MTAKTKKAAAAERRRAAEATAKANERIRAEQRATRYGSWPASGWASNGARHDP